MTEEEKKTITREKHHGRVTQGHKLAAIMKKRKEEILRDKEKSSVQPTVQSIEQSIEQPSVQSNGTLFMASVYLLSSPLMLAYFLHITLFRPQIENKSMKNNHQNH